MDAAQLIAALQAQRKSWVEVADGKKIQIIRPPESEMGSFIGRGKNPKIQATLEQVQQYTVGWQGITEADLLGAEIGTDDDVAFDAALWAEVSANRTAWTKKVATALVKSIMDYAAAQDAITKN